jgi:predicted O-methyltransferase YrrM
VRREDARRTLEAGLGWAVSTLFICEGLLENGGGRHVATDPFQLEGLPQQRTRYEGAGLRALEEAGVREIVEFHPEESQVVFPRLLAEGRRFDLAFLDGNHRFEGVFLDLVYAGRLLAEGGIVFADDAQLPGVRRAVDFCLANLGWTVEEEGAEGDVHEWIVLRTGPREAFLRPFAQFANF